MCAEPSATGSLALLKVVRRVDFWRGALENRVKRSQVLEVLEPRWHRSFSNPSHFASWLGAYQPMLEGRAAGSQAFSPPTRSPSRPLSREVSL